MIAVGIMGGIWVVYDAQFKFALLHNYSNETAAQIQAAVPELVWIAMALVGLSQALRGRKSARVTSHILLFFSLSMGAQLMYAMPNPGGYLVAIITPLALAILLETFIDGVYRWARARDGEPVEERSILATVGKVLRRIPKLFWLLPLALLVGFVLDFHGTAQGTRAVLLTVVPWAWLVLLAYPVAWLIRLWLDKESTATGLADWLTDHIPYAPGRTKVQDDALRAREDADAAGRKLQSAEQMAEQMVRKAERNRDQAIDAERSRANEAISEADARVQEMQEAHTQEVQRLQSEYAATTRAMQERHAGELAKLRAQLERAGADAGAATTELRNAHRAEMQQVRDQAAAEMARKDTHHQQQMEQVQQDLDRISRNVAALESANDALNEELEYMRTAAPSKMRLRWLYEQLHRQGDERYGRRDCVREVAHEFLGAAGMSPNSIGTAVGYLNSYLEELDEQHGSAGTTHALAGLS